MVRLLPVLSAVVLLLSAPVVSMGVVAPEPAATDAAAAQQSRPANTSSILQLDEVQASNVTRPGSSLATELSMQGSELDGRFKLYEVEARLANLDSDARVRYALNETARLQAEVDEMLAAEEEARQAYTEGEISAEAYAWTLTNLHARSVTLQDPINRLLNVQDKRYTELTSELGVLRSDIAIFTGPIQQRLMNAVRDGSSTSEFYIATSSNGVVLSEVRGNTFVREAYRSDYVNKGAPAMSITEVRNRLSSQYPWVLDSASGDGFNRFGRSAWQAGYSYSHGSFTAYFYANTTGPYREIQYKTLSEYPFENTQQTFDNDRILSVSQTYPGGPLEVNLTNQTGAPLDGEIRSNGSVAGQTGDDGLLWVLQPEGEFTVTALHEGERISLDLTTAGAEFGDGSTGG